MASRSLGILSIDMVAKIGGWTDGLTKAERAAQKSSKAIAAEFDSMVKGSTIAFTALTGAAATAFAAINSQVESISAFQGLSEKVGDSAEAIASLKLASDVSGVSLDTIAAASVRLTATLSKTDEEGEGAANAIKSLGLEFDAFKKLAPVDQLESVARAMAGFEDGSSKTAVAVALLGRSGAELLPFMNDLANGSERYTRLTAEAIQEADKFSKSTARLKSETESLMQYYAGPAISGLNAFIAKMKDGQTQSETLTERYWRQTAALRAMLGIGSESNPYAEARKGVEDLDARLKNVNLSETRRNELLKERNRLEAKRQEFLTGVRMNGTTDPRSLGLPQLEFDGTKPPKTPKAPKDNSAEQEARAQLAFDLDAIRNSMQAFRDLYGNNEKLLDAMRGAGLVEEAAYYQEKRRLLDASTSAQVSEQERTIERLRAEQLTGAAEITNKKQIADAEAALSKIRADAVVQVKLLGIEQTKASNSAIASLMAQQQAAQSYLDTMKKAYAADLAGLGLGNKARAKQSEINSINARFEQQRQDLANSRLQAELSGPLGPEAEKRFADQLALIEETNRGALASYENFYAKQEEAQKNWLVGASEALANYRDEAANVAKQMEQVFGNAFRGLEDQVTNLFTGKKVDLKGLFDSINEDVVRSIVKDKITGPLAGWLQGAIGGGPSLASSIGPSASLGTLSIAANSAAAALANLTAAAGGSAVGTAGGGLFGNLVGAGMGSLADLLGSSSMGKLDIFGMSFGGFFEDGGHLGAGKWGIAGENGPELIKGPAQIVPESWSDRSKQRGGNYTINVQMPANATRQTGMQFGAEISRQLAIANARNN